MVLDSGRFFANNIDTLRRPFESYFLVRNLHFTGLLFCFTFGPCILSFSLQFNILLGAFRGVEMWPIYLIKDFSGFYVYQLRSMPWFLFVVSMKDACIHHQDEGLTIQKGFAFLDDCITLSKEDFAGALLFLTKWMEQISHEIWTRLAVQCWKMSLFSIISTRKLVVAMCQYLVIWLANQ